MRLKSFRKTFFLLIFLGILLSLPQVFWGYNFFGDKTFYHLHPDEKTHVEIGRYYFMSKNAPYAYPKGLGIQMVGLQLLLNKFRYNSLPNILYDPIILGRLLSIFYGLMLVIVIYKTTLFLYNSKEISVIAIVFSVLCPIFVLYRHWAIADIQAVLWMWLTIYLSLCLLHKYKLSYLILGFICAGMAIAVKGNIFALLAVFIGVISMLEESRQRKVQLCILGLLITGIVFLVANGFLLGLQDLSRAINIFIYDNVNIGTAKTCMIIMGRMWKHFTCNLMLAVGIPIYVLFIVALVKYGARRKIIKLFDKRTTIIAVPIILYFFVTILMDISPQKLLLPIVPLVIILAAKEFNVVVSRLRRFRIGLAFLVLISLVVYQLYMVYAQEIYFFKDPRQDAGHWLMQNIPKNKIIGTKFYNAIPLSYKTIEAEDPRANYVILNSLWYKRFLSKKVFHSYGSNVLFYRRLLKGEQPYPSRNVKYEQIKEFSVPAPLGVEQRLLFEKFYPPFIGDVRIYKIEKD